MNNKFYGYSPQREYRKGIALGIWQIVIIGLVFMMLFSDYVGKNLPRAVLPFVMVTAFLFALTLVLPSRVNIGKKVIEEIFAEMSYACRKLFEWGLKRV